MNWLLIIVLLFLAWNIAAGYMKGFLRVVYYLVEWILVLTFVTWATPYVTDFLTTKTPVETKIEKSCENWMQKCILEKQSNGADAVDNAENPNAILEQLGLNLPDAIADKLLNTNELADQIMQETDAYGIIAKNLSAMAIKGLAYIITLVLASLIFFGIGSALKIVEHIPILSGINRMLGLFAGTVKGFLIVWIAFALIAFFRTSAVSVALLPYIYEAPILKWLYENNIILSIIMPFL